ncbi:MAG: choice-of-anchor L domain-containing protein [Saprospiraceae bacterium]
MLRIKNIFFHLWVMGIMMVTSNAIYAQIQTEFTFTPEELVRERFIKGNCQNVANIETFGDEVSIGYFRGGGNIIGIDTGIVISTGHIRDVTGPNDTVEKSTSFDDASGDRDLDRIATGRVFDATGIEFDFVPLSDRVTFNYVFASEEYCEFVGSAFNDNFGFFVSGPGINGTFADNAINVALLPDSEEFVSINTVNYERNINYYIQNELPRDATNCDINFAANYLDGIQFDGFTVPLKATFEVIPCETYHIRLVVADVADDKLDSAVFLQSKSFDLGDVVTVRARSVGSDEPIAYEDCRNGEFVFTRGDNTDFSEPLQVDFTINPASEATPNLDFIPLPASVTIPAGERSVVMPVEVLTDELEELPERLRLDIEYDCDCFPSDAADLIISDLRELSSDFPEILVCVDQPFSIGPTVTGGAAPYQFLWNTGATTPFVSSQVDVPRHYEVTITDDCGATALAIAAIDIQEDPMALLTGEGAICVGDTAFVQIEFTGNAPWSILYERDGNRQPRIRDINENPFVLPITQAGEYELIEFTDAFCTGNVSGMAEIASLGVEIEFTTRPPACPNSADGSIEIEIIGGSPPFDIRWNNGINNELTINNLSSGSYAVSITDAADCLQILDIELTAPDDFSSSCLEKAIYIPNIFSPNGDDLNDNFTLHFSPLANIQFITSLQIFDRWGNLVLNRINLTPSTNLVVWDGFYQNQPLNAGVFVWQMELELGNGETEILTGDLTLVR